jgi:peptide/nickel transport system substrate-binding protein
LRCVAAAVGALVVTALTACAAPDRPAGTAVIASGADLESGNPLVTMHPLSRQLQRHALFVTLVRLDSLLQPMPYYARSWEWNVAHTELRFALHGNLAWHDGVPTTARDVKFSLDAVRDVALGAPRAGDFGSVSEVLAPDDSTVIVRFSGPVPTIPVVFAELPIAPRHLLDSVPRERWRAHPYATAPVGNGPFRFVERVAGRRWRFERNDAFPATLGGPPALSQLVVAVVDEPSTKFAGLVSGELDMAGVSPVMAHLVERDPSLELLRPPVLFSNVLTFNTTRAPFDDVRVRRAISMSLDRERIVRAAVAGFGIPAGSALPSGLPMSNDRKPIEDVAAADALLDAAGWPRGANGLRAKNGQALELELLTVSSGELAIEQLIQADLRARGITVDIRVAEMAAFLTQMRAPTKDYDMAVTGIPGDIAAGHLRAMFSSSQKGGALDYTGWHDAALDVALEQARVAEELGVMRAAWQRVDSILADATPVAWIYHSRGVQGKSRALQNVRMDVRGELVNVARWTREVPR